MYIQSRCYAYKYSFVIKIHRKGYGTYFRITNEKKCSLCAYRDSKGFWSEKSKEIIRFSTDGMERWRACHACFLILYTVTTRFPWECTESVPRIDQGFTLPIAVTRERSDRPSLSFSNPFSPRHYIYPPIVSIVDRLPLIIISLASPSSFQPLCSLFSLSVFLLSFPFAQRSSWVAVII